MPSYFISGRNAAGRRRLELVRTATAPDALEIMEERRFTDLILHSDELAAAQFQLNNLKRVPSYAQFVKFRGGTALGHLRRMLGGIGIVYLGLGALLLLINFMLEAVRMRFDWTFSAVVLVISLVAVLILIVSLWYRLIWRLDKLLRAVVRAQWQEVLQMTARGANNRRLAHELAFRRAQAFAALGRLDEGFNMYERYCDANKVPEWVGWMHKSFILSSAGKHPESIECLEMAMSLSPMNPTVLLQLAVAVLQHRHDVRLGRELLECARAYPIADTIQYLVTLVEGVIALYDNNAAQAQNLLNRALQELALNRANPMARLVDSAIRLHLATAFARLGEIEEAERQFRQAEPLLSAHRRHELIQEYQDAMRAAASNSVGK